MVRSVGPRGFWQMIVRGRKVVRNEVHDDAPVRLPRAKALPAIGELINQTRAICRCPNKIIEGERLRKAAPLDLVGVQNVSGTNLEIVNPTRVRVSHPYPIECAIPERAD